MKNLTEAVSSPELALSSPVDGTERDLEEFLCCTKLWESQRLAKQVMMGKQLVERRKHCAKGPKLAMDLKA